VLSYELDIEVRSTFCRIYSTRKQWLMNATLFGTRRRSDATHFANAQREVKTGNWKLAYCGTRLTRAA